MTDIDLRFVLRQERHEFHRWYVDAKMTRVLQWRKKLTNEWGDYWTDWEDVPLVETEEKP
jgi:hypothetical protein